MPSFRIRHPTPLISLLLLVHVALLAWGGCRHSPTPDEVGSLAAEISHWKLGRFDLYRVNAPLVRMVATIPVVLAGAHVDWSDYNYGDAALDRVEYSFGEKVIHDQPERALWLLLRRPTFMIRLR